MLKWPQFDIPFEPALSYWLGGISVYDREQTVGEAVRVYNPNESSEREVIVKKFLLSRLDYFSYRHKYLLLRILENSLKSSNFDFSKEFEADYDENYSVAWDETEINDPRGFFEDIYRLANEQWKDDLQKASLEDQSTW
ncbi:hypothetical protein SAMN04487857_12057 [Pseudomonas sp. ok272]|uniref:hypothetical protein n=1 Tax=unclassified Pseudomonas TaxID=196821 RepID=UPI0008C77262|nr:MULTISPECIES: hypothetical protein [unclassified Pseudomonas]SEN53009.1 hypothetical protein SAMN04487857_12057 [Pseudomonas sp. ok272]SFN33538.1 hypothetical protein SAMN04487858_12057 [Pseudomonas sp. ok602]